MSNRRRPVTRNGKHWASGAIENEPIETVSVTPITAPRVIGTRAPVDPSVLESVPWSAFHLVLCGLALFVLWATFPAHMSEPGGSIFDPAVTLGVSSIVGQRIARKLRLPPLIGVLWMAILWHNLPGHLTAGTTADVPRITSKLGLAVILIRAGFGLDLKSIAKMKLNALMLALVPLSGEAVVHSLLANKLFGYNDYRWAFLHGIMVAAVSPAIVVPGVLSNQQLGYGTKGGPLVLMLSAVSIDTTLSVWAITFVSSLIFNQSSSIGLAAAMGPIQLIGGIAVGIVLGIIVLGFNKLLTYEAYRDPHRPTDRAKWVDLRLAALVLLIALGMVFYAQRLLLPSGGAIAVMAMAVTIGNILTMDKQTAPQKVRLSKYFANVWDYAAMPGLFCFAGSAIQVNQIFGASFLKRELPCLFAGLVTRATFGVLSATGTDLSWRERLFMGVGWCGKATVQASLGAYALNLATSAHDPPPHAVEYATNVKNAAILAIIIPGTIASITFKLLGPRIVRKDEHLTAPDTLTISSDNVELPTDNSATTNA